MQGYRGPALGAGTLGFVACLSFLALSFHPSHLPSPASLFLSRDRVHVAQVGLELADMDLEFLSLFPLPPKCWVTGVHGPGLPWVVLEIIRLAVLYTLDKHTS